MRKSEEVEQAKYLMNEAMEWSTLKWMWEKQRVREAADRANAILERRERNVKSKWREEDRVVYRELAAARVKKAREETAEPAVDGVKLLLQKVVDADHSAAHARAEAEDTFDQAEKQLSTSLAKEGCKKAIKSWTLHEKAIRQAEAVIEVSAKRSE